MISETWESLTRNKPMTLAAITTAGISVLLLAGFLIGWYEVERQLSSLPDRFEMRVFLRDDVTAEETAAIRERLSRMSEFSSVRFVSREEGWQRFRAQNKQVTKDLPNPLPDSFIVKLRRLEYGDIAARKVRLMPEVDHDGVVYLQEEQRQVMAFMRFVRAIGLAVTAMLTFSAATIIFNSIRLTVLARRREIRIMRLVGAAPGTIRTPFLLEAGTQGMVGGLLAACLLWIGADAISGFLPGFVRQPEQVLPFWMLLSSLAGAGGFFGLVCGAFATRRFLRHEPVV